MGRSQETFNKKEVRNKKEKKRKEKAEKRLARKEKGKSGLDDMIAYVDENGVITSTPPEEQEREEVNAEDIVLGVPKKEDVDEDPTREGILDFFNESKGFGFIRDLQTKESIFVHINNFLDDNIIEGNKVSFLTEKGPKGLNAVQVKRI